MNTNKASHRLFFKHEKLATYYANKVFDYDKLGYEKADLIQDLKIKIFASIKAYGRKWAVYKQTGKYKPIPLEFYLRHALRNKVKDYIKELNKGFNAKARISIGEDTFDIGYEDITSTINFNTREIVINEIDLLSGLTGHERGCYCMFLQGLPINKISMAYKGKINAAHIIQEQNERNRRYEGKLYDFSDRKRFEVMHVEEV